MVEDIFDLAYIVSNLFKARHARKILLVISEVFGDIELDIEPTSQEESFTEPFIDYTGYFDEDEDLSEMGTQHSSTDSDYHHHSGAGH